MGNAVVASPASTSIAITPGFAIQSGDVIVAMINANGANTSLTDDNGSFAFHRDWTLQSLDGASYYVLHRVAGASEPATYRWTWAPPQTSESHDQGLPRRRHQRRLRRLARPP